MLKIPECAECECAACESDGALRDAINRVSMMSVLREAGYSEDMLSEAKPRELFRFYLECEGIIGYADADNLYDLAAALKAKEQIEDDLDDNDPYGEGYTAGVKDLPPNNPYASNTDDFEEWSLGYSDGLDDRRHRDREHLTDVRHK